MTIAPGSRLGPYEILSSLGMGGMGEVWRARDPKLGREVAIKVLPEDLAADHDRLVRFEREARSASALNHPNIVTIHEIGEADGRAFLVMERIEGQTLRELMLEGPLATRRLLSIAAQIADGLARAHEIGIVHRDLKPENVMVTKEGLVKILDFGLARQEAPANTLTEGPTLSAATEAGTVLGTIGYMSPEQASGKPVDSRSDQFSLGVLLYEMATGRRPFRKDTPLETLSAVLRDDPEPVAALNPQTPAPLRWIIERCLAKNPEERYVATRDLARDLASVRDHLSEAGLRTDSLPAPPRSRRLLWPILGGIFLLAAVAIGAFLLGAHAKKEPPPSYHRLTFRRGYIHSARFAPDGQTIIYGAAWDGKPVQLFSTRPGSPESAPFMLPGADVFSISSSGQLALALGRHFIEGWETSGTLAQAALSSNAPREILENVLAADWAPDGVRMAVVRKDRGLARLEFPIGKRIFETTGWISHPRVSPRGDAVAFLVHPLPGDDAGTLALADQDGKTKTLSEYWVSVQGLAWSPEAEIWYTASRQGTNRTLHGVTPAGRQRIIADLAGTLQDVARDRRALVTRDNVQARMFVQVPGETAERDLSWLDGSVPADISSDGKTVLFAENVEGGGAGGTVYLRQTDGSPPVRLADGYALALSPDKKWAIASPATFNKLHLLPTGVGEARTLEAGPIETYLSAAFLPDGKKIVIAGNERGHRARLFVQDLAGGGPRPVTGEGEGADYWGNVLSPDGKLVTGRASAGGFASYPVEGGAPVPIRGLEEGEVPVQWSADGRSLYVCRLFGSSTSVFRLDLASGARELWRKLAPFDTAGVNVMLNVVITPDATAYAYSYGRTLSDLYLVEGYK